MLRSLKNKLKGKIYKFDVIPTCMHYSVVVECDKRGQGMPSYRTGYSHSLLRDHSFTCKRKSYFASPKLDGHFMLKEYYVNSTNTETFGIVDDESEIEPRIRARAFEHAEREKSRLEDYLGVEIGVKEKVLEVR